MSEKHFGEVFKQILDENMSVQKLSKLTGISRTHLYRICNDESEPSLYILHKLSKVLSVDLVEYYKIYTDFSDFNEYKKFLELRELIENDREINIDTLDEFLKQIKIDDIKKGVYLKLVFYSMAMVSTMKYKNYNKAIKHCLIALDVKDFLFRPNNIEKYIVDDVDFSILHLLAHNFYKMRKIDTSLEIGENLINIVEKRYIKSPIVIDLPKIVFRTYVATINNVADTLFKIEKYEESISYCNKGITFLNEENSLFALSHIYEVQAQCYCMLGLYDEAFTLYENAKCACFISRDREHLVRIEDSIRKYYPICMNK